MEEVLSRDGVTHVVRVGMTVRRPVRPFTATVHSFLRRLRDEGLECVPEPLGYDEYGREVLGYVAGRVPIEPLPDWATSDAVLAALALMIRRLHDAAEGWKMPADAVWGCIPCHRPVAETAEPSAPELVAHQDYCPGNVVFRRGLPAALIDFDLARPTTRVADCVNAMYWWGPLLAPQDRAVSLVNANVPARCRVFADAYSMSRIERSQVASAAVRRAQDSLVNMRAAAECDPVFARWWAEGVGDRLHRAEAWTAAHEKAIEAALLR